MLSHNIIGDEGANQILIFIQDLGYNNKLTLDIQ
jgi:hypothetical protein